MERGVDPSMDNPRDISYRGSLGYPRIILRISILEIFRTADPSGIAEASLGISEDYP